MAIIDFLARRLQRKLQQEKMGQHNRRVSLGDLLTDRWENARQYGFGEGSSCYDNVLVIGDVKVGRNTWIGPNVVLDGSGGGLVIGDNCTICAGVQIYTHDSVEWALSGGEKPYAHSPTQIGSNVFVGPNSVIARGVTIGSCVAIGALSFVNKSIQGGVIAMGNPATVKRSALPQDVDLAKERGFIQA